LRDYARLGGVLAHDGAWHGRQLVPASWIRDATTVRDDAPHLRADVVAPGFGYGYQTWLLPGPRRMFILWGAYGQRIFVDPQSRLVMVITSVHKLPLDVPPLVESGWLWYAMVRQLGR